MLIRTANQNDMLSLLKLAEEYYEKNDHSWNGMDVDYVHTARHMLFAIEDENQTIILAEECGEVLGGVWLRCGAPAWTPQLMVNDLFLYVRRESRTYPLARQLILAIEKWAKTKNASKIFVGANSGVGGNKAMKALYKRFGYSEIGTNFTKEI